MSEPPRDGAVPTVTFRRTGLSVPWDPACACLLDFAEANGLMPDYSCRNGICNTCLCAVDGPVTYVNEPLDMPEAGKALICSCIPAGDVSLDL